MTLLELSTNLFPDRNAVIDAVSTTDASVRRLTLDGTMDDAAWDAVVAAILDADTIIAL